MLASPASNASDITATWQSHTALTTTSGKPGLAGWRPHTQFSLFPILSITMGWAENVNILTDTIPPGIPSISLDSITMHHLMQPTTSLHSTCQTTLIYSF